MKHNSSKFISPLVAFCSVATLILQTGCTSYFKRQDCEATNWFEYGRRVALTGKRLSGDTFVGECRAVEAEIRESELDRGFKAGMARYCEPAYVFGLGKSGHFFSNEMCEGERSRQLAERHRAGVEEYCQKANGFAAGAAGQGYNRICPQELEASFLPEFNRGRKKYLTILVIENEKKIGDLDRDIYRLQAERNSKASEAAFLLSRTGYEVQRTVEPGTGLVREQVIAKQSDEQKRAVDDMNRKIRYLDSDISAKQQQQSRLRDRNREILLEAVRLDDQS